MCQRHREPAELRRGPRRVHWLVLLIPLAPLVLLLEDSLSFDYLKLPLFKDMEETIVG